MSAYLCRWPTGDISFTVADTLEDAANAFDEFDNVFVHADNVDIRPDVSIVKIDNFLIDCSISEDGTIQISGMGDGCILEIEDEIEKAMAEKYPKTTSS